MGRYGIIARLLDESVCGLSPRDTALKAISAIRTLSADVGIPKGLVDLGKRYGKKVEEKDIAVMTGNAQKDACMLTNPRRAKDAEIAAIFKAAL